MGFLDDSYADDPDIYGHLVLLALKAPIRRLS